jgi:hypothetical protein
MPTSPCEAGTNTIAASPWWMWPSALTMSTWMVAMVAYSFFAFSTASSIVPIM